ncbi:hypothetical protein L218DRAFT_668264 [Marasmius fiardii PR-910]|nr:hypothetical protein L218DRAFT_668264 [Marasmius fiardii PR-910]
MLRLRFERVVLSTLILSSSKHFRCLAIDYQEEMEDICLVSYSLPDPMRKFTSLTSKSYCRTCCLPSSHYPLPRVLGPASQSLIWAVCLCQPCGWDTVDPGRWICFCFSRVNAVYGWGRMWYDSQRGQHECLPLKGG